MRIAAIIPAAGVGTRMGGNIPKQFLKLGSHPLLIHTLAVFESWSGVEKIIVVIPEKERNRITEWVDRYNLKKVHRIVSGGPRRQDSVYNGLKAVGQEIDIVLIHDGVRPLVTSQLLEKCAETADHTGTAIAAIPIKDTVKEVGENKIILRTLDRNRLWAAQTPQGFRREILMKAMEQAIRDSFIGTDEASLVERLNIPVTMVEGSHQNIKITTPEDLFFAEAIMNTSICIN
jgi:2-C-methyl-D-erythritol 4-phosphate cytidylyltransferase